MLKIILSGCLGRMGRTVASLVTADSGCKVACGVDSAAGNVPDASAFRVYRSFDEVPGKAGDVIVDFSNHAAVPALLNYAVSRRVPAVLAATGYTPGEAEQIKTAADSVPVFRSSNMSIGVNVLIELAKAAAKALDGFDCEIVEAHHNKKLDAPSGTALMLADAVKSARAEQDKASENVYDRTSVRRPRGEDEIGISSIRGGTIVGEHEVIFAGDGEVVTLRHSAETREIFARGALRAAKFIVSQAPGEYGMPELIKSL